MRLVAFLSAIDRPALGARHGPDHLIDLTAAGAPATLDEVLRQGESGFGHLRSLIRAAEFVRPVAGLRYLSPLQHPGKALAVGLNYRAHATESHFEAPERPVVFQRFPSSWVAHMQPLMIPRVSNQFDYEAELVAVIGKAGRYIQPRSALEHVAGYSIFNDGSLRDFQFRSHQWTLGKNFDRSGSFGPDVVTTDDLPPGAKGLRIQCRLNGAVVQDANTSEMIFGVAELIAACSEAMTLEPGDIIITGTPSGVGMARTPPLWMKSGDVCEVEIEHLGVLRNPVAIESI